ncbi:hypothetical protein SISNIDRAFT_547107 [Sistotremastrum niveocremeum HHB9708]|uniref:Uncharacterized protein n=1 Tax=Sistotremastrum niveocremeum HHB9708 TaxID=1314777 RepID=A0A164ZUU4_9AGAM|nr:hypothetical protein SISNIDRAFT_547107 [Sistotremastrum niveocremeum HHB9708]
MENILETTRSGLPPSTQPRSRHATYNNLTYKKKKVHPGATILSMLERISILALQSGSDECSEAVFDILEVLKDDPMYAHSEALFDFQRNVAKTAKEQLLGGIICSSTLDDMETYLGKHALVLISKITPAVDILFLKEIASCLSVGGASSLPTFNDSFIPRLTILPSDTWIRVFPMAIEALATEWLSPVSNHTEVRGIHNGITTLIDHALSSPLSPPLSQASICCTVLTLCKSQSNEELMDRILQCLLLHIHRHGSGKFVYTFNFVDRVLVPLANQLKAEGWDLACKPFATFWSDILNFCIISHENAKGLLSATFDTNCVSDCSECNDVLLSEAKELEPIFSASATKISVAADLRQLLWASAPLQTWFDLIDEGSRAQILGSSHFEIKTRVKWGDPLRHRHKEDLATSGQLEADTSHYTSSHEPTTPHQAERQNLEQSLIEAESFYSAISSDAIFSLDSATLSTSSGQETLVNQSLGSPIDLATPSNDTLGLLSIFPTVRSEPKINPPGITSISNPLESPGSDFGELSWPVVNTYIPAPPSTSVSGLDNPLLPAPLAPGSDINHNELTNDYPPYLLHSSSVDVLNDAEQISALLANDELLVPMNLVDPTGIPNHFPIEGPHPDHDQWSSPVETRQTPPPVKLRPLDYDADESPTLHIRRGTAILKRPRGLDSDEYGSGSELESKKIRLDEEILSVISQTGPSSSVTDAILSDNPVVLCPTPFDEKTTSSASQEAPSTPSSSAAHKEHTTSQAPKVTRPPNKRQRSWIDGSYVPEPDHEL